jgi:hypothetical protein
MVKVQIHSAVKKIDEFLFSKCLHLRSVELHEGLEVIGQCAFAVCHHLKYLCPPEKEATQPPQQQTSSSSSQWMWMYQKM